MADLFLSQHFKDFVITFLPPHAPSSLHPSVLPFILPSILSSLFLPSVILKYFIKNVKM